MAYLAFSLLFSLACLRIDEIPFTGYEGDRLEARTDERLEREKKGTTTWRREKEKRDETREHDVLLRVG